MDHPSNGSPGGPYPTFLGLGCGGVDIARSGHDVHDAVGPGIEPHEVVVMDRPEGRLGPGVRNDTPQPQSLGIPLTAHLVAHDPGGIEASRIDAVVGTGPKLALEVGLAQVEPSLVSIGLRCVPPRQSDLFGGLASGQEKSPTIGRVPGQVHVIVGLVDPAGVGQSIAVGILPLHPGHGGGDGTPTVVQESRVGGPAQDIVPPDHEDQL